MYFKLFIPCHAFEVHLSGSLGRCICLALWADAINSLGEQPSPCCKSRYFGYVVAQSLHPLQRCWRQYQNWCLVVRSSSPCARYLCAEEPFLESREIWKWWACLSFFSSVTNSRVWSLHLNATVIVHLYSGIDRLVSAGSSSGKNGKRRLDITRDNMGPN